MVDGSIPTAVYTGVRQCAGGGWTQAVCVATGDDDLRSWQKDAENPVVGAPPPGLGTIGFRDPWVWADGDGWAMIVGTGTVIQGGAIALYRSHDLREWQYEGLLLEAADVERFGVKTGRIWECPHLARVGNRDVLVFSVWDDESSADRGYGMGELHYSVIVEGEFDGHSYHPISLRRLDDGPDFYAAAFLRDGARTLVWGWSWEALDAEATRLQGWAGALTFPRELVALPNGGVASSPAPELHALRKRGVTRRAISVDSGVVDVGCGNRVEVEVDLVNDGAKAFGVDVLASDDGREATRIRYDVATTHLVIDRSRASLRSHVGRDMAGAPVSLQSNEPLSLRIFVDRSIVEVFANDGFAATARAYPALTASQRVRIFAEGGQIRVPHVTTWSF